MSEYNAPNSNPELVKRWLKRARESQISHYYVADFLSSRGRNLGIATIILTSITGVTSLLAKPPEELVVGLGAASLLAAFLTSLQTFFKYEERAGSHTRAGSKYASVRRNLELSIASQANPSKEYLDEIRKALDDLAETSPNVSRKDHEKAMEQDAS